MWYATHRSQNIYSVCHDPPGDCPIILVSYDEARWFARALNEYERDHSRVDPYPNAEGDLPRGSARIPGPRTPKGPGNRHPAPGGQYQAPKPYSGPRTTEHVTP